MGALKGPPCSCSSGDLHCMEEQQQQGLLLQLLAKENKGVLSSIGGGHCAGSNTAQDHHPRMLQTAKEARVPPLHLHGCLLNTRARLVLLCTPLYSRPGKPPATVPGGWPGSSSTDLSEKRITGGGSRYKNRQGGISFPLLVKAKSVTQTGAQLSLASTVATLPA